MKANTDDAVPAFEAIADSVNYPMFLVTTTAHGAHAGCMVGFTSQASIRPSRFLVALSEKNHTFRIASQSKRLAVHILPIEELSLARLFGEHTGDHMDKFAQCSWHEGPDGVRLLDAAAGWFSGPIIGRLPLGDHVGFLIEPDAGKYERQQHAELITFADVTDFQPGHDA